MDRRTFIASAATALLAMLPAAFAQQQDKLWRIGFFYFGSRQSSLDTGRYNAFVQGMREHGYVDGRNVIIETRFGDGKIDRLPSLAAELVDYALIEHLLSADPAQLTEVSCYVQ